MTLCTLTLAVAEEMTAVAKLDSFPVKEGGTIRIGGGKYYVLANRDVSDREIDESLNREDTNAALKYINAYNQIVKSKGVESFLNGEKKWKDVKEDFEKWTNDNHEHLDLLDKASSMKEIQWPNMVGEKPKDGEEVSPFEYYLPHLSMLRNISKVRHLRIKAAIESREFEKVKNLYSMNLNMAKHSAGDGFLINYLAGIAIRNNSFESLIDNMDELPLEDFDIDHFFKDNFFSQKKLMSVMDKEFDGIFKFVKKEIKNKKIHAGLRSRELSFLPSRMHILIIPEGNWAKDLKNYIDTSKKIMILPYPEFIREYKKLMKMVEESGSPILKMLAPSLSLIRSAHINSKMKFQMTQAMVALKRYEKKYGAKAKSISDLIPEYLKEWPKDGYNGSKMRYKASDGETRVYFTGENNIDHGGDEKKYSLISRRKKK